MRKHKTQNVNRKEMKRRLRWALLHPNAIKIWRWVCGAGVGKSGYVVGLTEQIALDSDECRLRSKVCAALEKVPLGNHALP